jgi:hypothetical protein
MSNGFSWFQTPGRTPQLSDLDHQPFWRRHFWPPSAAGIIVISLVMAVVIGFVGALVYTSADNARIQAVDPTDESHTPATVAAENPAAATTTSKPPEILNAEGIAKKAGPSVWSVSSLDEAGRPVEGSGFVAGSFGGQTYVVTSLSIVKAATRIPGPDIVVRNGGSDTKATLWTWQEERDLALLVLGRSAPSLNWAGQDPAAKPGDKAFVLGGAGGSAAAGTLSAISPSGIQHNVPVDDKRLGAPLLNDRGQVLGILTRPPGSVDITVVPVAVTCERVLSCGSGNTGVPAPGDAGAGGATSVTSTTVAGKSGASTTATSRATTSTTRR